MSAVSKGLKTKDNSHPDLLTYRTYSNLLIISLLNDNGISGVPFKGMIYLAPKATTVLNHIIIPYKECNSILPLTNI